MFIYSPALSETPSSTLSLEDVPRFKDHPINKIPKYVFENCNQATCNDYAPETLEFLRKRTKDLTRQALKEECEAKEESKGDQTFFIQKGEEYDWLYGLDALENEFCGIGSPDQLLEALLKVETIMKYNGLFSRFASDSPGEFRKKDICWAKHDLNVNEMLSACVFELEFHTQMGMHPAVYFAGKNHKADATCLVKKSWIARQYTQIAREGFQIQATDKVKQFVADHWHEINIIGAASDWIAEQNREDGKLDLVQWFDDRYHYFPLVSTLPDDLKQSLEKVKEAKEMHPIEKACRVWYDIVRIHISHEANKRTGKAMASIILLAYGVLPPKIGKKEEKEFLNVFKKALAEENGYVRLIQFMAKMIFKTQQEYADLASD